MERMPTEKLILYAMAAVGIIALVAVAPGMGHVLKMFGVHKKFPSHAAIKNALSRMKQKGYVVFLEKNGKRFMRLTREGERRLVWYRGRGKDQRRHLQNWDGKWRLVSFDIPETHRVLRNYIRTELREAGFMRLHNSTWVSPYDAEEFVALLKGDRHIGRNVLYVVAEHIEYDKPLKAFFKLS